MLTCALIRETNGVALDQFLAVLAVIGSFKPCAKVEVWAVRKQIPTCLLQPNLYYLIHFSKRLP